MSGAAQDSGFDELNTLWQAALGRLTLGISPAEVNDSFRAWVGHLAQAPGKMAELAAWPALCAQDDGERPVDPRFQSEGWGQWPWSVYRDAFLKTESWWQAATSDVPGLDAHSERVVAFGARQILDALCPANFPVTNPDLARQTLESGGANLVQGAKNALDDMQHALTGVPDNGKFKVGKNLAVTPGDVVYRNGLMELIRYAPQTPKVYKEPVLIVPAWIMKYYILDLSPDNSLVRWLVEQGHTVFMISWKNPGKEDRALGFDDYYRRGVMDAMDAVTSICGDAKIHLTGYCLGGTLAMVAAAAMARDGDDRLKSLSLFAAQGDFTEAGELMLFVSPSEVAFLKSIMDVQGYLDTKQMAGTFQMLRSYDLIWSKIVSDYFEGKRRGLIDLMVWNADATRMPARMHSEYLERLFLHNELAEGRFTVEGKPVAVENIRVPIFAVGTERDHVAPWRSVHKIHLMANVDVDFVLVSGGHNAGIVSEPGHPHRSYRELERKAGTPYRSPDQWLEESAQKEGSWWTAWHDWLARHAAKEKIIPPKTGKALCKAPGTYVFQR